MAAPRFTVPTVTVPDITELESKALTLLADAQQPAVDYVTKVAETLAARLPEDRPELLTQGIDAFLTQVDFAKKLLDTEVKFAKAVLDAAVQPIRPARVVKAKTVKAA